MSARRSDRPVHLVELFASLQGEGQHCGEPQVFLRLAGCPLRCLYCDTPEGLERPARWTSHSDPPREFENPTTLAALLEQLETLDRQLGSVRTISITGGEPLIQVDALAELLPELRGTRRRHLETAGVHPEQLSRIVGELEHVSMDFKLASTMEKGDYAARHRAFLEVIRDAQVEACTKIVITPAVTGAELDGALDLLAEILPAAPLFLTPVTPDRHVDAAPSTEQMENLAHRALQRDVRVRVLPQLHKLLGLR